MTDRRRQQPGTTTRVYRSPLRERRAQETRQRVLAAAADRFVSRGFVGTTLAAVAADAGVSVDSVVGVGSKAQLLLECFRLRYAGGSEWRSILERPAVQEMFTIEDPEEGLEAAIEFLVTGHQSSADLWFVVRSAVPFDPVVAAGMQELLDLKRESFAATADWLLRIGVMSPPTSEAARAVLAADLNVVMSAETYVVLTTDWQMSVAGYRQWLRRSITGLGAAAPAGDDPAGSPA